MLVVLLPVNFVLNIPREKNLFRFITGRTENVRWSFGCQCFPTHAFAQLALSVSTLALRTFLTNQVARTVLRHRLLPTLWNYQFFCNLMLTVYESEWNEVLSNWIRQNSTKSGWKWKFQPKGKPWYHVYVFRKEYKYQEYVETEFENTFLTSCTCERDLRKWWFETTENKNQILTVH